MSINVLKTQPNISCFFTRSNRILIDLHYISKLKYQLGSVKAGRPAIRTTKLADQLLEIKAEVSAGLRKSWKTSYKNYKAEAKAIESFYEAKGITFCFV